MKLSLTLLLAVGAMLAGCGDKLPVESGPPDNPGGGASGGKLIFTYAEDQTSASRPLVASMAPDGTGLSTLVTSAYMSSPPRNGRMIFIGAGFNGESVIVSDIDGRNATTIATYRSSNQIARFSPALSEDGTMAAYMVRSVAMNSGESDTTRLYVVPVGGGPPVLIDTAAYGTRVAFSPDGKYIAYFGGSWTYGFGGGRLMMRDVACNQPPITMADWIDIGTDGVMAPVWSPSGDRILFTDGFLSKILAIMEVNVTTRESLNLASGAFPAFNREGTKVAYVSPTTFDIMVMEADGSDQRRLTNTIKTLELFPSWSSDGKTIACTAYDGDPDEVPGRVRLVNVNTETWKDITVSSSTSTVDRVFWTK